MSAEALSLQDEVKKLRENFAFPNEVDDASGYYLSFNIKANDREVTVGNGLIEAVIPAPNIQQERDAYLADNFFISEWKRNGDHSVTSTRTPLIGWLNELAEFNPLIHEGVAVEIGNLLVTQLREEFEVEVAGVTNA